MKQLFISIYDLIIAPVVDTILPPTCPVCDEVLQTGQRHFCTNCAADIPLTRHWEEYDNELKIRIQDSVEGVVSAAALFYFKTDNDWRKMIHKLKYRDQWRHGITMGRWFGDELKSSSWASSIDFVIAIPLHPLRMLSRGYNQADYIAKGVAESLGIPHIRRGVERTRSNTSQVRLPHHSRFMNVENLFAVTDRSIFENRDILLVDDVYTTGSTMMSCAETIIEAVPTCRVHIAALAISHKQFSSSSLE